MNKFLTFICLLAVALTAYSQSASECTLYEVQYEEFKANFKQAKSDNEKSRWLTQIERTLEDAESMGCSFPAEKAKEFKSLKKSFAANKTLFERPAYTVTAEADVVKIGVKQKNLQVTAKPDWLEQLETEDVKSIEFSVMENTLPYPRNGYVEVYDGKKKHQCPVTQEAAPLQANVTEHIGFGQDGGASFIFVETNDTAWSVSGDNSWLSTEVTDYGARIVCTANPDKRKRSANIKVRLAHGETHIVEISQAIGRTTLTVPQTSFTFSNYGETNNNVKVQCNYDQWSASADANWVKVKKKYGGISIECLPNTIATSRNATVKIETNDAEHLVEYISVTQNEAPAYLTAEQSSYRSDGYERTVNVKVNTNIPNWSYSVDKGGNWTTASKSGNNLKVNLRRNDWNSSRTSEIRLYGKGQSYTVSLYQPDRGYAGRYNDYFDANGGDWRLSWFCMEVGVLTSVGINVSTINFRWKPVEVSLINLNINYNFLSGATCVGWEPIVRGFLPVSRDGKWAAFVGMGAHVDFMDDSHFLIEFGFDCQWNYKSSSRIFFKYNGGCVLGMSYDIGKWY